MANGYSTMGVPGAVGMTRPSMGMTGGTIPNPSTMGMTGGTMTRPLAPFLSNLPLSNSPTIAVNESTPNLDRIQNFPVVSRNGVFHIHQDPATGQRYSMTDEFHARIPDIVSRNQSNRLSNSRNNINPTINRFSAFSEFTNLLSRYNNTNTVLSETFTQPVTGENQSVFVPNRRNNVVETQMVDSFQSSIQSDEQQILPPSVIPMNTSYAPVVNAVATTEVLSSTGIENYPMNTYR